MPAYLHPHIALSDNSFDSENQSVMVQVGKLTLIEKIIGQILEFHHGLLSGASTSPAVLLVTFPGAAPYAIALHTICNSGSKGHLTYLFQR